MTADSIFEAMSGIKSEYLVSAIQEEPAKAKVDLWFLRRLAYIAAAILILITIPFTVILANHIGSQPPLTSAPTYRPLTDLPGAIPIDPQNGVVKTDTALYVSKDELIRRFKIFKEKTNFVGTAQFVEAVQIFNGDKYWTLMVFDITVEKAILNTSEGATIRALSTCYYNANGNIVIPNYVPDAGARLLENPYAFFSLGKKTEFPPKIDGKEIDLSVYADFYIRNLYTTDGEAFYYFGYRIDLSEIQPDSAE